MKFNKLFLRWLLVDSYNAELEKVRCDRFLMQDFSTILNEQKAILVIDGRLSEIEAEKQITSVKNVRKIVNFLRTK